MAMADTTETRPAPQITWRIPRPCVRCTTYEKNVFHLFRFTKPVKSYSFILFFSSESTLASGRFWMDCLTGMTESLKNKDKAQEESREKFEEHITRPFTQLQDLQREHVKSLPKEQEHHRLNVARQWKMLKRMLMSERSPWGRRCFDSALKLWLPRMTKSLFIWALLTGLVRFPRSRLATLFFEQMSMCSYQKPGLPRSRFCDRDLGNFPIWTIQSGMWVTGTKLFRQISFVFATLRPKWYNFRLECISPSEVCELPL